MSNGFFLDFFCKTPELWRGEILSSAVILIFDGDFEDGDEDEKDIGAQELAFSVVPVFPNLKAWKRQW